MPCVIPQQASSCMWFSASPVRSSSGPACAQANSTVTAAACNAPQEEMAQALRQLDEAIAFAAKQAKKVPQVVADAASQAVKV